MKTNHRQIWSIWICLLTLITGSCSTDDIINNGIGSTLTEADGYRISTFTLPQGEWEIPDADLTIDFLLRSLSDNSTSSYEGKLKKMQEQLACDMYIPYDEEITDGDYILSLKLAKEGHAYPQSYHLVFLGNMVDALQEVNTPYDQLEGEGSENEPYLIRSVEDFAYLVSQLVLYDATYGYGKYFRQTTEIQAPQTNCLYQGKAYKSAPFAGNYDGGSHTISRLNYTGGNTDPADDPVGLFSILYDGATIRNLNISGANIQNPGSYCGLLAGKTQGEIRIENVNIDGEIEKGADNIGGLIGYAAGSNETQGKLILKDITFNVRLSDNKDRVGGLIGFAENVNITADSISSSPFNLINGEKNVGGLIGKLQGQINASKLKLSHSMEKPDPFIIKGTFAVGGIIGELLLQNSSTLKDIHLQMPVQGTEGVGGLAGRISSSATDHLIFKIDNFQSPLGTCMIKGEQSVGGLVGFTDPFEQNAFKIQLSGESLLTADITASDRNAGGAFGKLFNTEIIFDSSSSLEINSSSVQSENTGGGFVGWIENCGEVSLNNVSFSPFMNISGQSSIGGIAGILRNGTIAGNYTPVFSTTDVITDKKPVPLFAGNINTNKSYWYAKQVGGAIGYAERAVVKNIFIAASIYGIDYVGGVIGQALETNISNCGSHCSSFNNNGLLATRQGGIAGSLSNQKVKYTLENLVNFTSIGNGENSTGGIFGEVTANNIIQIKRAVNLANITSYKNVGGIIGSIIGQQRVSIEESANYGAIQGNTGDKNNGIGGLVGKADKNLTVYGSVNHGNVTATQDATYYGAGGIIGYNANGGVHITFSCNRADINFVKSKENSYGVGGLAGTVYNASSGDQSIIQNCYNQGGVYGQQKETTPLVGTDYRGGLAGKLGKNTSCDRCINGGNIGFGNAGIGDGTSKVLTNIYVLEGTGGTWSATKISHNDRNNKAKYPALDFNTPVWVLDQKSSTDNNGMPYLNPEKCYFQFAKYVP